MQEEIHLTVAAVIERGGRFLCVEERVDGALRVNQPAGHLEPGESLTEAVVRETLEETAYAFEPVALLGIYRWRHPQRRITYVRVAFVGRVGATPTERALDEGIERALWLTAEEVRARRAEHRSPLVMRCVDDHIAGHRFALTLLADVTEDHR